MPIKPAKILHGDYKGGIIEEYMEFCRIWDKHVISAITLEDKQQAVVDTINECISKGYLVDYLNAHRMEIEKIMITM